MKGDRRLVLVPPADATGGAGGPPPGEPPPSAEEARAARALAEALERGEDPLAAALRAAAEPRGLDQADHDALIAAALGDEDAPPTRAEQRAADRLRGALEGAAADGRREGGRPAEDDGAALAAALRAAWRPEPLPALQHEALIARALARRGGERHRRIAPVTMAALSTIAAIAAGVALMLGRASEQEAATAGAPAEAIRAALIPARSTVELFDAATPFPREGGETARIDRIAGARAADLRANRYAAWGVR